MLQLKPKQKELISLFYSELKSKKNTVVVAPTGFGKTIVATNILKQCDLQKKKGLFVVDRSVLVPQTIARFNEWGLKCGVIKAGYQEDRSHNIQIASIQSLNRRNFPPSDLILLDECHVSVAKQYDDLFSYYNDSLIGGFTATPWRLKRFESLASRFESLVYNVQTRELIDSGDLCKYKYYKFEIIKTDKQKVNYASKETMNFCLDKYLNEGEGKPAISFEESNKVNALAFAECAKERGITAACIFDNTNPTERSNLIKDFEKGNINILISIGVLSIGFDSPIATTAICRRPTKSLSLYIQQVGRVLRTMPGKEYAIILDFVGHFDKHGLPCEIRKYDFLEREELEGVGDPIMKVCPNCNSVVHAATKKCPDCGYVFKFNYRELLNLKGEMKLVPTDPLTPENLVKVLIEIADIKGYNKNWINYRLKDWGSRSSLPTLAEICRYAKISIEV